MNYEVGKIDAAVDQLDWAIRLFLDHQAYVPSITLAGAAEEIIGESLGDVASLRKLQEQLSLRYQVDKKVLVQNHLNRSKNWLKHWNQLKDAAVGVFELETEAISYILRAITNLANHDHTVSSETPRFLQWLQTHRKDLRERTDA